MKIGNGFQRHAAIFIQNTFIIQHVIKQMQGTRSSSNIQRNAIISGNQTGELLTSFLYELLPPCHYTETAVSQYNHRRSISELKKPRNRHLIAAGMKPDMAYLMAHVKSQASNEVQFSLRDTKLELGAEDGTRITEPLLVFLGGGVLNGFRLR
jgi:hypothetical protein